MAEYMGSVELISGITPKNGGTFPLAAAKDIQVDNNGKRLDTKLAEIDNALENASSTATTFDLAALGLPAVPEDGTVVSLQTDTTGIMSALDRGSVKFLINAEGTGSVEMVMNKYSITEHGLYMCVYAVQGGLFTLMIADGSLQAAFVPMNTLPTVTTEDNGKVLGVVDGAWAATTIKTSAEIPTFDLTIMGLATIPMSGGAVDCEMDTTDIRAALDAGATKFIVYVELVGAVELVMNKVSVFDSSYICCSLAEMSGAYKVLTIIVEDTYIMAKIGEINSSTEDEIKTYIDEYIGEALGGDY